MSTLSQFFGSGGAGATASTGKGIGSVFRIFTTNGSLTVPSDVAYVSYGVIGGGSIGCSGGPDPSGSGGGFSYQEGAQTSPTPLTICATVGSGGGLFNPASTGLGCPGGTSCISGFPLATICATGGCTSGPPLIGAGPGGAGSGGMINTCGGIGADARGGGGGAGGLFSPGGNGGSCRGGGGGFGSGGGGGGSIAGSFLDPNVGQGAGGGQPGVSGPGPAQQKGGAGGSGLVGRGGAGGYLFPTGASQGAEPGVPGFVTGFLEFDGRFSQAKTFFGAAGGGGGGGEINCGVPAGSGGAGGGGGAATLAGNGGFGGGGGGTGSAHGGIGGGGGGTSGSGGQGIAIVEYWCTQS